MSETLRRKPTRSHPYKTEGHLGSEIIFAFKRRIVEHPFRPGLKRAHHL